MRALWAGPRVLATFSDVPYLFSIAQPEGRNSRSAKVKLVVALLEGCLCKRRRGMHDY